MTVSFAFKRGRLIVLPVRVRRAARSRRPMMALDTEAGDFVGIRRVAVET